MELFFLIILMVFMALALGSGFPVAMALPGAAILTILLAGVSGYLFTGDVAAYFHSGTPQQWLSAGVTNLRSVYWVPQRDTLIAVPLFIFMGIMLQKSMVAEDLLVAMAQLFGPVPGGLGISVVFVGALLAATTGIVGATVVAMGLISLPAMLRNNYSPSLATGTIAASGTLGQIIPPSIVLIILADQLSSATDQAGNLRRLLYKHATGEFSMPSVFDVVSTSAGEMFLGALVPGLLLVVLYMAFILIYALIRPKAAPAIHREGKFDGAFAKKIFLALVPPLTLIFMVLGSIIAGVATVNQAGAIGSAGAMVMAGYRLTEGRKGRFYPTILGLVSLAILFYAVQNYSMNIKVIRSQTDAIGIVIGLIGAAGLIVALVWSGIRVLRINNTMHIVMVETAKTTALVFVILMGAAILTAAFRAFGGEFLVHNFLDSLPGGFWTKFTVVMGVIFILGFFIDFIEISVVVVPIVAPILLSDPSANITAVWLGVMIGLNMQTSFLTPPFGFALFYLRGVAPAVVKTIDMYKGVIPFILLQLIALGIVALNPPLVNYLPNRVKYLSVVSPPPRNPQLQVCLEKYVRDKIGQDGGATLAAIRAAGEIDISILPKRMARDLSQSFAAASSVSAKLDAIEKAHAAVVAAAPAYRPVLSHVRRLQKQMFALEEQIKLIKQKEDRSLDAVSDTLKVTLETRRKGLEAQVEALKAQIPPDWGKIHKDFAALMKAETDSRNAYRMAADKSYQGPEKVFQILSSNTAFAALEDELRGLETVIRTAEPAKAVEAIKALEHKLSPVAGAGDVKSALGSARRELKRKKPNMEKVMKYYDKAVAAYDAQKVWRTGAGTTIAPKLKTYLDAIRPTLGARSQRHLTREQALSLAACTARPNDISLHF